MRSALMLTIAAIALIPLFAKVANAETILDFSDDEAFVFYADGTICEGLSTSPNGQICDNGEIAFDFVEADVITVELPKPVVTTTFDFSDDEAFVFYADGTICEGLSTSPNGQICDNGEIAFDFVEGDVIIGNIDEEPVILAMASE